MNRFPCSWCQWIANFGWYITMPPLQFSLFFITRNSEFSLQKDGPIFHSWYTSVTGECVHIQLACREIGQPIPIAKTKSAVRKGYFIGQMGHTFNYTSGGNIAYRLKSLSLQTSIVTRHTMAWNRPFHVRCLYTSYCGVSSLVRAQLHNERRLEKLLHLFVKKIQNFVW